MISDHLLGYFNVLAEAPSGIDLLRGLCLDLALRGKFHTYDLPSEDLSKAHKSPGIDLGIPSHWGTVSFSEHFDMKGGGQPPKSTFVDSPQPGYIRLYQIRDYGPNPVPVYIPSEIAPKTTMKGDILLARYGASGKVFWAEEGAYNVALAKLIFPESLYLKPFAFLLFKSNWFQETIRSTTRVAVDGFNKNDLKNIHFPLPPLDEQWQIISKVDELMALCDQLEQQQRQRNNLRIAARKSAIDAISNTTTPEELEMAWNRISRNWKVIADTPESVSSLRSLILDLAVRGKLVSQNMTAGRPLFNEVPGVHQIPKNWVWTRLDEIAEYGGVGNVSPNEIDATSWVLDLEDIEKGSSRLISKVRSSDRKTTSNKASFKAGDVLYGKLRPYLDKVLVADEEGFCTTEIVPIRPKAGIDCNWLRLSLKSPRFLSYVSEKSYGMKMPRLGTKDARESLHAVPPLEEQKSIVNKVNELMTLCDQLEFELVRQRALEESIARSLTGSLLNDE